MNVLEEKYWIIMEDLKESQTDFYRGDDLTKLMGRDS